MATIQAKTSRGHKYWYIVESRRVNGKPRPIVLAYLGKPNDLLKRLQGLTDNIKVKSYSHGAIAALLEVAQKLDIPPIINKYIESPRKYMPEKPIRNSLTAGITFLLGAIGRVCMPTSKRGWWNWAKTTSCEYLLRCSLSKIDSQHFWDLMDALPVDAIPKIESELLKRVQQIYRVESNTLFFDTTNFFSYIDTTNIRCTIAQRGKNKQKRNDLRQIGLALVVTKEHLIPLFHLTYKGNRNDTIVFKTIASRLKARMLELGLELNKHTLVFDRGNNSKKNMGILKKLGFYYVGALTPYHHKKLIEDAEYNFELLSVDENKMRVYRDKRIVWGEERTVIVYISEELKAGQLRGIYQSLAKKMKELQKIRINLSNPEGQKRDRLQLEERIKDIINGQYIKDLIEWSLKEESKGKFQFDFNISIKNLNEIEDKLGFRILMTNRHDWGTEEIIKTYWGQADIENAFKNLKNPYHLTLKPQFHWTDQKIIVHYFICVLGFLLTTIIWRQVKIKIGYKCCIDTLLDTLNNIRLATLLEKSKTRGRVKAEYKLEEMSEEENMIMEALEIIKLHINRPKFNGVGVYN
jgi:transposase